MLHRRYFSAWNALWALNRGGLKRHLSSEWWDAGRDHHRGIAHRRDDRSCGSISENWCLRWYPVSWLLPVKTKDIVNKWKNHTCGTWKSYQRVLEEKFCMGAYSNWDYSFPIETGESLPFCRGTSFCFPSAKAWQVREVSISSLHSTHRSKDRWHRSNRGSSSDWSQAKSLYNTGRKANKELGVIFSRSQHWNDAGTGFPVA